MIGKAAEKILNAGAEQIIASDTIPSEYSKYSVAEVLVEEVIRGK